MSGPSSGPWNSAAYQDLVIAMAEAAVQYDQNQKQTIVDVMASRGHSFTWNAIRPPEEASKMSGKGPGRKVQAWTESVHNDILIAFNEALRPNNDEWNSIMSKLRAMGHDFSEGALRMSAANSARSRVIWGSDDKEDKEVQLLKAILNTCYQPKEADLPAIAAYMLAKFGTDASLSSLRQHLGKLRKKDGATPMATPKKEKGSTSTPSKGKLGYDKSAAFGTPSKRPYSSAANNGSGLDDMDDLDDDLDKAASQKRVKKERIKTEEPGSPSRTAAFIDSGAEPETIKLDEDEV